MKTPELVIPSDIPNDKMPDLLRHWHLGSKARRHLARRRFAAVTGSLPSGAGSRALDVGCGWGYNLFLLASRRYRPFGIDIVRNDFYAARAIAAANGYESLLAGADMSALPFSSGAFAAVTAVETLEHVYEPDRASALREAARALATGGVFALSTPNYHSIVETGKRIIVKLPALKRCFPSMCYPAGEVRREEYHPYRYHKPLRARELRAALESAGFKVERMSTIIFIWKNTPDFAFPILQAIEWILESIPLVKSLASTLVVVARKAS